MVRRAGEEPRDSWMGGRLGAWGWLGSLCPAAHPPRTESTRGRPPRPRPGQPGDSTRCPRARPAAAGVREQSRHRWLATVERGRNFYGLCGGQDSETPARPRAAAAAVVTGRGRGKPLCHFFCGVEEGLAGSGARGGCRPGRGCRTHARVVVSARVAATTGVLKLICSSSKLRRVCFY